MQAMYSLTPTYSLLLVSLHPHSTQITFTHTSPSPTQYTHHLHPHSTHITFTHTVHTSPSPTQYTQHLHPHSTHITHPHSTHNTFTHTVHTTPSPTLYTHHLHPHSTHISITSRSSHLWSAACAVRWTGSEVLRVFRGSSSSATETLHGHQWETVKGKWIWKQPICTYTYSG